MRSCVYCKKISVPGDKRSFHTFPTNERLKLMWIRNIGKTNWVPSKHTLLCSDHFTTSCIDFRDCRPRLRKGSIPTVFDHELDIKISSIDNIIKEKKIIPPMNQDNESLIDKRTKSFKQTKKLLSNNESLFILKNIKLIPMKSSTNTNIVVPVHELNLDSIRKTEVGAPSVSTKLSQTAKEIKYYKEMAEHDHYYTNSPNEVHLKLRTTQHKVIVLKKEKKVLVQKVKRMQDTIKSLKEMVKKLRSYKGIETSDLSNLRIKSMTKNTNNPRHGDEIQNL